MRRIHALLPALAAATLLRLAPTAARRDSARLRQAAALLARGAAHRGASAASVSTAKACAECASAQRCDDWKPGWPGGEVDTAACAACISQPSCLEV